MSKKISELPEYLGANTPLGDVPITISGTTYRITPQKILTAPVFLEFGQWDLVRHAEGNTGTAIQMGDFAHGRVDADLYCLLGRYKNFTEDNDTNNPLNYEYLSMAGLNPE